MKRASRIFSEQDRQAVAQAIRDAESATSAEIVPVIATVSGRYDRAEDIVGLLVGLIVLAAGWLTCSVVHPQAGWESGNGLLPAAGLIPALLCVVVGFIAGSALATWFPVLRLPFIPATEMDEEVAKAAQSAFAASRVRKTAGATGVLLYVSLYEHRVVVLPDDGIEGVADLAWANVRDLLIDGLRRDAATEGLVAAIGKCGETLSGPCPRSADDVDDLGNELRFID